MAWFRKKERPAGMETAPGEQEPRASFFNRMGRLVRKNPCQPVKTCPSCGTQNPGEVIFCKECGSRYPVSGADRESGKGKENAPVDIIKDSATSMQKRECLEKGNACYKSGKFLEALEMYDRAIQADPEYAKAWNNRSLVLQKLGRNDEARESRNRYLALQDTASRTITVALRAK